MPASASDINSAIINGYSRGYALCHDGKVFEYRPSDKVIDTSIYDIVLLNLSKWVMMSMNSSLRH